MANTLPRPHAGFIIGCCMSRGNLDTVRTPTMVDAFRIAEVLPGTVFVGGSVARGDAHAGSDIDLLCIVDRDDNPDRFFDMELTGMASEMSGWKAGVIKIDWPKWVSYIKVPTTIEANTLREGRMLKWVRPGDEVDWTGIKPARQVLVESVDFALALMRKTAGMLVYYMTALGSLETEALDAGDAGRFWGHWKYRLGWANAQAHYLMERAFLLLCHLTGTPFKNRTRLLQVVGDYPKRIREHIFDGCSDGDVGWVGEWRKAGYWNPEHPPDDDEYPAVAAGAILAHPRRYATGSGVPYDQGTVRYVDLVTCLAGQVVRFFAENYPEIAETLSETTLGTEAAVEQLNKAAVDSRWVYAHGFPLSAWERPWESQTRGL